MQIQAIRLFQLIFVFLAAIFFLALVVPLNSNEHNHFSKRDSNSIKNENATERPIIVDLALSQKELFNNLTLENDMGRLYNNHNYTTILDQLTIKTLASLNENKTFSELEKNISNFFTEDSIIERTEDCKTYFEKYISARALQNKSSKSYPLSFSHLIHYQVGVFEVFMATSYLPQNTHCIYIDGKSTEKVFRAVNGIVKCYREVFLQTCSDCGQLIVASNTIHVIWGHISILEADLICLNKNYQANQNWKFHLNLAGSELPLVSIDKMQDILSQSPGSIIDSFPFPNNERWKMTKKTERFRNSFSDFDYEVRRVSDPMPPTPYNLQVLKGCKNVALTRDDASMILTSEVSKTLYNWIIHLLVPDESFFSTLASVIVLENGTVVQDLTKNTTHGLCVRATLWYINDCAGRNIRGICNLGVEDLPRIKTVMGPCIIANKFRFDVSSRAILVQRALISD